MQTRTVYLPPDRWKPLLSYNLAIGGWHASLRLLEEIQSQQLQPSFGLFEGLMAGACVLYGRPFMNAQGWKGLIVLKGLESFTGYSDEAELTYIHKAAREARDKVLAHQDLTDWASLSQGALAEQPVDEIAVSVDPNGRIEQFSPVLFPRDNLHELLPHLVDVQIARVNRLRDVLLLKCLPPGTSRPDHITFKEQSSAP